MAYLLFNGLVGAQLAYRVFKVPSYFIDTPAVHVHWTKSDDVDRDGETVRWVVKYTVFNGSSEDANSAGTTLELDDTWDDTGTTTRVVQRTASGALVGVQSNYYIAVSIEKGTPGSGTPMDEPGVVSLDFTFNGWSPAR